MTTNIMDRRRINGPSRSVDPVSTTEIKDPFENGRIDGRALDQARPIFTKPGSLSAPLTGATSPSGMAYYEQGKVRVSCAIYGPRQSRKSSAKMGMFGCDFKYAPFSCSWRKPHAKGSDEKDIALMIEQAIGPAIRLEAYPKATIDAFVTVIESDGKAATIAAAINCVSAALADAGIELYDSVAACSMAVHKSRWVLDCTQAEEDVASCSLLVSHMPSVDEITYILQSGKVTIEQTKDGVTACVNNCAKVYAVLCRYLQISMK